MLNPLKGMMTAIFWWTIVLCSPWGCTSWRAAQDPPRTVAYVDLNKYLGFWYEIASLPAPFQDGCVCTRAHYTLAENGDIEVLNTCRKGTGDGPFEVAKARARVVPGTGNAKLEIEFFWPFKGDYWIIGLDPDYRWALVGHPSRRFLWVLSRTPKLASGELEEIKRIAVIKGYHLDDLRLTYQGCPASP